MLFVGDDWAENHRDIEVQDESGHRLGRARLPEGIAGLSRLHELLAEHLSDDDVDPKTGFVAQSVVIGIETDRGPWVSALVAAGYQVFPLNPVQVARYRERHGASGAKSDRGDAHVLAEIVRLDRFHHRPIAGDSLPRSDRRYLTHRQLAELADGCGPHRLMVLVAGYTGLRWGELTGLRVRSVDPLRGRLEIVEAVTEVDGTMVFGLP